MESTTETVSFKVLLASLPRGEPLSTAALQARGLSVFRASALARSGWLVHLARGVYMLPGDTLMQPRLAALGMQEVHLPEGPLRGHTFHYSQCTTPLSPLTHARRPGADSPPGEPIYRQQRLTASYMHAYFPSHPETVAGVLGG